MFIFLDEGVSRRGGHVVAGDGARDQVQVQQGGVQPQDRQHTGRIPRGYLILCHLPLVDFLSISHYLSSLIYNNKIVVKTKLFLITFMLYYQQRFKKGKGGRLFFFSKRKKMLKIF